MITRSVSLPRRSAATMPPRIESGTTSTKASAASLSEFTSDGPSRSADRHVVLQRRAEVAADEMADPVQYCDDDRTVDAVLVVELDHVRGLANGPRTFLPMSPGRSCAAANTITLRTTRVMAARAKRLSRKRAMTVLRRMRRAAARAAARRVLPKRARYDSGRPCPGRRPCSRSPSSSPRQGSCRSTARSPACRAAGSPASASRTSADP